MNSQETLKWLQAEIKQKNTLAEAYLAMLEHATPETRDRWFEHLGKTLNEADEENLVPEGE